jgi:hypothetical protein
MMHKTGCMLHESYQDGKIFKVYVGYEEKTVFEKDIRPLLFK